MPYRKITFDGILARGLGEGTYYMSMQHYQKEIKKKLGFMAYPGTLNIKVAKKQADLAKNAKNIEIKGFKRGNKILGGANCHFAKVNGIEGAIIAPHLTKHKNIIEFIAPMHVKSELKLKDGDKVKIELLE